MMLRKKGLPQLEILRDLLKRRIVDAEVKRVKKLDNMVMIR